MFGRIGGMADRSEVESRAQRLLRPKHAKDYGPNGVQAEAVRAVHRVARGRGGAQGHFNAHGAAAVAAQFGLKHRLIGMDSSA